ncbi:MAG: glycosyltransferase [Anaerolineales bacterium]|nr:glycosyltransferase [Anaerolineales bacterium]
MTLLAWANALLSLFLSVYGIYSLVLAALYLRHRNRCPQAPAVDRRQLPPVTVQVPVYNELHVIERVIDALAALDYPQDKLHIQILDDSTDETTELGRARAAMYREQGLDIAILRRDNRSGYKAGALAWGLIRTESDYVAIFDADFRPEPGFLLQTIPLFLSRPQLGMLQTRWAYLNTDYSPLTRAQALAFDGHYVVEKVGQAGAGLLLTFNGSAGIWRRQCIEAVGNWQSDTLCEDLDLSYRAQLAGWSALYLRHVTVPAELPPQMAAFRGQQARWAQGASQCLRKLAGPIARSASLTLGQKVMGLAHLSSYLAYPLLTMVLLLSLPLLLVPSSAQLPLGALGVVYLGQPLVYALSQRWLYRSNWGGRMLRSFPLLALLGMGMTWSNTKAVWRGLTRWGGPFVRTPKFRIERRSDGWTASQYRLGTDPSVVGELALALYMLITTATAIAVGRYAVVPFTLLSTLAFSYVVWTELTQSRNPGTNAAPTEVAACGSEPHAG